MTNFDKEIVDQFKIFGFKYNKTIDVTSSGALSYSYYPENFQDKYYVFLIFQYNNADYTDHRLSVHMNDRDQYLSTIYQIRSDSDYNKTRIREAIQNVFAAEIRTIAIRTIIE